MAVTILNIFRVLDVVVATNHAYWCKASKMLWPHRNNSMFHVMELPAYIHLADARTGRAPAGLPPLPAGV